MKKTTLLFLTVFLTFFSLCNAQSVINITTSGGSYTSEKWVNITTEINGAGTQVWGQGDGTYSNGAGLINEDIELSPGVYYVNCYDKFADSWDGTLISITAYGEVLNDNGGNSPDDGSNNDVSSDWEPDTPELELEVSLMITVPDAPSCLLPLGLTASNITTSSAVLSWEESGTASLYNVEVVLEGETATGTPTDIGVANGFTKSDLTPFTEYDFYVQADCESDGTSGWVGPYTFSTLPVAPENDDCSGAIALTVNEDLECTVITSGTTLGATESVQEGEVTGTPNTDVWFSFVATYPAHEIEISNVENQGGGTSTSTDMGMAVYDATAGCEALVFVDDSDPNTLILEGLDVGTTYYVRVYGWYGTVQYNNFDICVGTLPCLEGEASGAIVADCDNGEFSIEVEVTDQGDILHLSDGTTTIDVTGSGTYIFGPYISGSEVDIDAIHTDEYCDFEVDSFIYDCPPSNDDCTAPISLIANMDLECTEVTSATTLGATASSQEDDVTGTPNTDVWFSFEAISSIHQIVISNVVNLGGGTSTSTDMGMAVYDATNGCEALTIIDDSDPNTLMLEGLEVGTLYYVRVYGWSSSVQYNTFDICLGSVMCMAAETTAAVVPDCDNDQFYIDVLVTEFGDLTSLSDGNQEQTISESQPLYNFGPYSNGTEVTISAVHSNTDCDFEVDSFNYSCPPENDACSSATLVSELPYNFSQDAIGATNNDGFIGSCSYGMNDGVWYTFMVDESGTIEVDISEVTGWDLELAVYSGTCGDFTCVTSSDSGYSGDGESVSFTGDAGVQYYVNIGYYGGSSDGSEGPFTIDVSSPDTATLSPTLSIVDHFEESSFSYYPNPVENVLNIKSVSTIQNVSVFNMVGQEVLRVNPAKIESTIDMSQLSIGAYFVQVTIDNIVETIKVVKH
ncbi:fibronectin type III domain-containing protein [Mangrovimonas sp. YM274]|uniref:fibronectin type III domain-containing protein n=1 Tax=Mangrovimonas sp. YM274 TaxID=3070660 RepID=UPI0027DD5869|nr:fibronectin type III domain-containing protein [Mangrovimonas sp. YM274]WMI67602.1 fibronectin type III domain-containing protein [Mangrovimonas sp. YM274]